MNAYQIKCDNCFGSEFNHIYFSSDHRYKIPGNFEIICCNNCGIYYTYPQLDKIKLSNYYPRNYIGYTSAIDKESNFFRRIDRQYAMWVRRNQIKRRIKAQGKLLDIGCATGIFLNTMKEHGWECYGLEPDKVSAEYASNIFDIPVFNGYLNEIKYPNSYFDVVTLWDVLEHTQNPSEIMQEVERILKPKGFVFLSLPNSDAFERLLFGACWCGWDVPRHYLTFNRKNIMGFLSKYCFTNIQIRSFYGHHGVFIESLNCWLEELALDKNIIAFCQKVAASNFIRIISLPIFLIIEKFNRSTIMSVSAQKK